MALRSISIVVTTYSAEREQDIAELFASIARQNPEGVEGSNDIEVILVVEGPDSLITKMRQLAYTFSPVSIKVVSNTGSPGLSGARNTALRYVDSDVVAFVDDDAILFGDWSIKLKETFSSESSIVGVTGVALPLWEDPQMEWLPEEFYWVVSCTGWLGGGRCAVVRNAWGVNMAFKRRIFDHVLFDERFGGNMGATDGSKLGLLGEDTLFSVRACKVTGGVIAYNPEIKVYHKVHRYRLTSRYLRRRAFWEGFTKAALASQHGLQFGLGPERVLLRQILFGFFPRTFCELPTRPALSGRRLSFAVNTLSYVALGYASAKFRPLRRLTLSGFGR
jgi:glycosyltransferase involved in cell wall biosynthesis